MAVTRYGLTWWGQRWITALEDLGALYANRLPRGRTYARRGAVTELSVAAGKVTARVKGSRARPYRVTLGLPVFDDDTWQVVVAALADQVRHAAALLDGQMPPDVDEVLAGCGVSLFPRAGELDTNCSCPDWANPCKHVAATYYLMAEAFDDDPFLIFAWRGRTRDELLNHLAGHGGTVLAGSAAPEGWTAPAVALPDLADCVDSFYDNGCVLPPVSAGIGGLPPDALLRELHDPPVEIRGRVRRAATYASPWPCRVASNRPLG